VQLDLAAKVDATAIVVRHAEAGGESAVYNTRDFDVQTSVNGIDWTTVAQVRGNTAATTVVRLPAPALAKFARVAVISATQTTEQTTRIYEVEVYGVAWSLLNVAPLMSADGSGGATGDPACAPGQTADKVLDGKLSGDSKWCSHTAGAQVAVDLGVAQNLAWITVRHAGAGGETAAFDTRDYDLQTSMNGSTWVTVAQVRGNAADSTGHLFTTPVTARYVRLHVLTPTQTADDAARIYEIETYVQQ
jgi:hypothetical protein